MHLKIRLNSGRGRKHAVTQLVEALLCKPKGRGFDWNFLLMTQSFRQNYDLEVDSDSDRNDYQEGGGGCKGGQCVRLKTLTPSYAHYLEI
jgi:hypothetical protein